MIEHLKDLFAYEAWANERCIRASESIYATDEPMRRLLSHVINAHGVWLARIEKRNSVHGIWDIHEHNTLLTIDQTNNREWLSYLDSIDDRQLEQAINYSDASGTPWSTPLLDIMQQILNHSTYHRGQIAARVSSLGFSPLPTDYIMFSRMK